MSYKLRPVLETLYSCLVWMHWAMAMWDFQLHARSCPISPSYPMATAAQKAVKEPACQQGTYRCSLHVQSPPGSPTGPKIQEQFALAFGSQFRCKEMEHLSVSAEALGPWTLCDSENGSLPRRCPQGSQAASCPFLKSGPKKCKALASTQVVWIHVVAALSPNTKPNKGHFYRKQCCLVTWLTFHYYQDSEELSGKFIQGHICP